MPTIRSLRLPDQLPNAKAICLSGQSPVSYDPGMWQSQYEVARYLARVPEAALKQRYRDILLNMSMLVGRERDAIPITSVQSSWYWFRKEHQTRLEFAMRGIDLPVEPPWDVLLDNTNDGAPVKHGQSDAGDALYRYDRQIHIEAIARRGAIRISPASSHESRERTHVSIEDGRSVPVSDGMTGDGSSPDYYVFCVSCDWDQKLFKAFEDADACLVIRDAGEFARRLESAAAAELPGWRFFHGPVHYYDPYERAGFEYIEAGISRDFRFAYQREYRFLWMPAYGQSTRGHLDLNLGIIADVNSIQKSCPG